VWAGCKSHWVSFNFGSFISRHLFSRHLATQMLNFWKFPKSISARTKRPRGPHATHGPRVWDPCNRHCLATIAFILEIYFLWHVDQSRTQGGGGVLGLKPPLSLLFYKNFVIRRVYRACFFYKDKGSVCRRICQLCQQTSLENVNMTPYCDVTNSAHQIRSNAVILLQ